MLDALLLGDSTCRCEPAYQEELQSHLTELRQLTGLWGEKVIVTKTNRKTIEGQGRWASAKTLLYNHEDLSLDPQRSLRKHRYGCAVCAVGVLL